MVSGKNGGSGPTATLLAHVATKCELENAGIPCSEAGSALATQLRRLYAPMLVVAQALCPASEPWSLLIHRLAKTPPVQVNLDPLLVLMIYLRKHKHQHD